jgi:Flp pilus assembly CpaF family ATPase
MNNYKHSIETKIINNNIEITVMTGLELIAFIMEEIELIKNIKGKDKKDLVISILKDFVNTNDNIFNMSNNDELLKTVNNLLDNNLISDIIDTMVLCANGIVKLNSPIIKKACCFPSISK